MEFEKLSLVFMFICMIALFVEIKKVNNKFNNIEHMTSTSGSTSGSTGSSSTTLPSNLDTIRDLIRQEYNHDIEAIRNLGAISKSLLTGKNYHNTTDVTEPGRLLIPADVHIQGWAVAVPIGTVITWALDTPPLPNTTVYDYNAHASEYNLADSDCWYPCIGGTALGISIPDLRGRLVVGQGKTNGSDDDKHHFLTLREKTTGLVPVGTHKHTTEEDGEHSHTIPRPMGDQNWSNGNGNAWWGSIGEATVTSNTAGNHIHSISNPNNTRSGALTDRFTKETVPHSTVLQYWIRVR